jgi:molybdopterin converting factor small subunit
VLARSQVWVNGGAADPLHRVGAQDEVAVLPPVSGGC